MGKRRIKYLGRNKNILKLKKAFIKILTILGVVASIFAFINITKDLKGLYKGRNIEGYNIEGTRQTQDRVKENLLNIINENIQDKVVLDFFSG